MEELNALLVAAVRFVRETEYGFEWIPMFWGSGGERVRLWELRRKDDDDGCGLVGDLLHAETRLGCFT